MRLSDVEDNKEYQEAVTFFEQKAEVFKSVIDEQKMKLVVNEVVKHANYIANLGDKLEEEFVVSLTKDEFDGIADRVYWGLTVNDSLSLHISRYYPVARINNAVIDNFKNHIGYSLDEEKFPRSSFIPTNDLDILSAFLLTVSISKYVQIELEQLVKKQQDDLKVCLEGLKLLVTKFIEVLYNNPAIFEHFCGVYTELKHANSIINAVLSIGPQHKNKVDVIRNVSDFHDPTCDNAISYFLTETQFLMGLRYKVAGFERPSDECVKQLVINVATNANLLLAKANAANLEGENLKRIVEPIFDFMTELAWDEDLEERFEAVYIIHDNLHNVIVSNSLLMELSDAQEEEVQSYFDVIDGLEGEDRSVTSSETEEEVGDGRKLRFSENVAVRFFNEQGTTGNLTAQILRPSVDDPDQKEIQVTSGKRGGLHYPHVKRVDPDFLFKIKPAELNAATAAAVRSDLSVACRDEEVSHADKKRKLDAEVALAL
ncbi:MAG: hypothetical protein ACHP6I_03870 [Rickettsiales bacterium]